MLVFIDDSGDPGFKTEKGSSKVFVIALVIFEDELEAEKTSLSIKELRRRLKVSDFYEFKFNKCSPRFKKNFIDSVRGYKYRVRAIVVKKDVIYSKRLKNYKEDFYNYIIMQVLKHSEGHIKKAKLKFDKRGEKLLRDNLRVYLSRELDNKNKKVFSDLKFADSKENTLIQLADMIAGSVFAKYSEKDKKYFEILKESRKFEDVWLFK
ncbi:MAG: DUF3800 domain-containing protein [Candidatus Levybacteria bacterium]|nr:DUF3800 domain-containing protein [Candidatus Levybacteria bacterium]